MAHLLRLRNGPCETWQLPRRPALTITNPPWGRRLMERGSERRTRPAASERRGGERGNDMDGEADGEELVHTWKQLAKFFKVGLHNCVELSSSLPSSCTKASRLLMPLDSIYTDCCCPAEPV